MLGEFVTLASSSEGNCYVVTSGSGRQALLIEAGMPVNRIKRALGRLCLPMLSEMMACVITHAHEDHCRAAGGVMAAGVDVYVSAPAAEALRASLGHPGAPMHRLRPTEMEQWRQIGDFDVMALPVSHDSPGACAWWIACGAESLLFLTDTAYCSFKGFEKLTMLALEANWSEAALRQALESGRITWPRYARTKRNHMSIERAVEFCRANDLSHVREIHLLHLSDEHADEEVFRKAIAAAVGRPVHVAPRWGGQRS